LSKLLKFKEWVALPEAARHLSNSFGEEVSEADVLRFALGGHLTISVLFMDPNPAVCGTMVTVDDPSECFDPENIGDHDTREEQVERSRKILIDHRDNLALEVEAHSHIEGVWDLLMRGGERYYVEDKHQKLIDGPPVYPFYLDQGIYVVRQDVGTCRVPPELPDGGIPNDSFLVVRTSELEKFVKRISSLDPQRRIEEPAAAVENAKLRKRIEAVLDYAQNRCPRGLAKLKMAKHIIKQHKNQDFSESALRQILSGRYEPMRRLGLDGLD
jgi:hypothetical protein